MARSLIGIMQGRLFPQVGDRFQCFPRDHWREEFPRANVAGLGAIEWIYDLFGADINPLGTEHGVESLKALAAQHGIQVRSVCADYFMDRPFLRASQAERSELIHHLHWLMQRCHNLGVSHIVLPFVDFSRIEGSEDEQTVLEILKRSISLAEATRIELHLETDLSPSRFAAMLARVEHPLVKVNYDSGNSASQGYHPRDEFEAYGSRIGSIHIKDRIRGGGTVPLGTGDADLPALFESIARIRYDREFILQVARAAPGEEVTWARKNREYVETHLLPISSP